MKMRISIALTVSVVAALLVASAIAQPMHPASAAPDIGNAGTAKADSKSAGGAQYVGAQTCSGCHDELYKGFMASPHSVTTKETNMTHGAHGCESCHGPGSAHVDGGGDKTKIFRFSEAKPDQISKRCLSCHEAKEQQRQFKFSSHFENGVSCTSCHSIHHAKKEYLLPVSQTELCFKCHATQRADFQKPFRHRVNEGLIQCSDCHNPHGGTWTDGNGANRQLTSTPNQQIVCLKCHMDKRGPFVYEHNAVRMEGCLVCHSPHGSTNARMLVTARINSLCLQCHPAPSGPHNQSGKAQDCILCHSQIHGSNISSVFFK